MRVQRTHIKLNLDDLIIIIIIIITIIIIIVTIITNSSIFICNIIYDPIDQHSQNSDY